ncbi:hypothetical protein J4N45_22185 [Vibrio sp. SCSIO 43140]|uniref:hypothetical protein n=1 Tax=Vibrio sp. SCSIO 43140 TaxID=2819100 RepID=UPI00207601C5|nr:hypothetical protein [Vibrio sp. SCSIO 43140]USD63681.1 hypothetical protein J4N45_22185 [Vibrio sp. SCSIO 43140]
MLRVVIIILLTLGFSNFLLAAEVQGSREADLAALSQDLSQPMALRVDATRALRGFNGANALIAISRASRDQAASMRLASIDGAAHWSVIGKWDLMYPLTVDGDMSVQRAAIYALLPHWNAFDKSMQLSLQQSLESLEKKLPNDIDTELERAWIEQVTGRSDAAEARLIELSHTSDDVRIAIGLSKVQLETQGGLVARETLKQAMLESSPQASLFYEAAKLDYALGFHDSALNYFEKAYLLAPNNSTYAYALAATIRENEPQHAVGLFRVAYEGSQDPTHLYAQCESMLAINEDASDCMAELEMIAPDYVVQELISLYQR